MKYTESTSLEEIGRWIDKNLCVDFYDIHSNRWIEKTDKNIFSGSKYRLVEEEWKPEVGEMVIPNGYTSARRFLCMDGDLFVCEGTIDRNYRSHKSTSPIPKEKPVAREGWAHPDDIKDPNIKYDNAMLRVRILEDE